jgi:hypothetical protein
MPNQRSPNKVRLGGFVEQELYQTVVAMAKREGFENDKFGFTQQLLREALAQREKRPRKRSERPSTRRLSAAA